MTLRREGRGAGAGGFRVAAIVAVGLAVVALGAGPADLGAQAGQAAEASTVPDAAPPDAAEAEARTVRARAVLDDLGWLAGLWRGEGPAGLNETWIMPPRAGVMTGAMRLTGGESLRIQEMITIAVVDGTVEMRLRHFDRLLGAHEDEPIALPLVEHGPGRAVFEGSFGDDRLRTVAEARPGGGWSGRTEITRSDGRVDVIESVFEPMAAGASAEAGPAAHPAGPAAHPAGAHAERPGAPADPDLRAAPAEPGRVLDTSYRASDGTRVLRQEIVVPAPADRLWPLFTTVEGFSSWAVPHAWIDFRVGGSIETSYEEEAEEGHPHNIRSRILSYVPERMLSIQAVQAPPGFPAPGILDELFTVIELEPVAGGGTRIVVSGLGYRDGEPYDTLVEFFRQGNAWTLEQLHERAVRTTRTQE